MSRLRVIAATGLAVAALFVTPAAGAVTGHTDAANAVAGRLGAARTAGVYQDRAGRPVVTVTDAAAARTVRAAGATPRLVARSGADLAKITAALGHSASLTGTAWAVDPSSDTVVVSADSSVTGARLARVRAALRTYGAAVRLRTVPGRLAPKLSGGDPIIGGGSVRCTAGVNVVSGATYYMITAGHCGSAASTWTTAAGASIGPTTAVSFPSDDFALVRFTGSVSHDGTIGSQDVTSAGTAFVGEHVCMLGATSGLRCGTVTGLNATVNYAEGTVNGLIQTNICTMPGDSGAPLFDGPKVLGILSGGSGDCSSGGQSFFQPIVEILSRYGVSVF